MPAARLVTRGAGTSREPRTDEERGAWERAWQRVYKSITRAGGSREEACEAARAEAMRVVKRIRGGGVEPDFGRRRVSAETRGAASRGRQQATTIVLHLTPESIAWLQAQAEVRGTTVSRVVDQMVVRRRRNSTQS